MVVSTELVSCRRGSSRRQPPTFGASLGCSISLIGVRVRVRVRGLLSCGALRARTSQSPGSLEFDLTHRTTTGARAPDRHPRAQAALRAHQLYSPL
eukprot:scaffold15551_cov62-Phaeocystis_antarctica.AAC.8